MVPQHYCFSGVIGKSLRSYIPVDKEERKPTARIMVPCPNRLDSVEVHNKSLDSVTVIVFFDNHKESTEIEEEQIIAPGASFHFQEKSLDMGSWTAIAPVKRISASHASGSVHALSPTVQGIVKKLDVHFSSNGLTAA